MVDEEQCEHEEQWEYKVVELKHESEECLNSFGSKGWELVTVTVSPHQGTEVAYFKRKKL